MSDTPQGGWWKAKDGKWYPPETHPDRVRATTASVAAGPPAAGWWQANDGNWYPPETHPDLDTHPDPERAVDVSGQDSLATRSDDPFAPLTEDAAPGIEGAPAIDDERVPGDTPVVEPPPATEPPTIVDLTGSDPATVTIPSLESAPSSATPVTPPPLGSPDAAGVGPGWGGFGGSSPEEPGSRWGSVDAPDPADDLDDATVERATPTAAPVRSSLFGGSDDDAPLPGWRRGADGAWYPPGVELPAATSSPGAPKDSPFPRAASGTRPPASVAPPEGERSSRRPLLIALGAVAGLVVLVLAGVLLFGGGDGADEDTAGPSTADDAATTTSSAPPTSAAPTSTVPSEPPGQVSGSGSAEVPVGRNVTEPLLALATHDGPGSFVVSFVGADGTEVQQPMTTGVEGPYLGVLPVNFPSGETFDTVRVDGEGPWAVTFAVVSSAPQLPTSPGQIYEGQGDQVLRVGSPEDLSVSVGCAGCGSPASLTAFDADGGAGVLLTPRLDVVTVPAGTAFLQVTARAPVGAPAPGWTMRVG